MTDTHVVTVVDGNAVEESIHNEDSSQSEQHLPLPTELRNEIMDHIHSDIYFLKKWQICRYGLEIGVHYHQEGSPSPLQLDEGYGVRRVFFQSSSDSKGSEEAKNFQEQQKTKEEQQRDGEQQVVSRKQGGEKGN